DAHGGHDAVERAGTTAAWHRDRGRGQHDAAATTATAATDDRRRHLAATAAASNGRRGHLAAAAATSRDRGGGFGREDGEARRASRHGGDGDTGCDVLPGDHGPGFLPTVRGGLMH